MSQRYEYGQTYAIESDLLTISAPEVDVTTGANGNGFNVDYLYGTVYINTPKLDVTSLNSNPSNPTPFTLGLASSGPLGSHAGVFGLSYTQINKNCLWNIWPISSSTVWPVTQASNTILLSGPTIGTAYLPGFGNTSTDIIIVENGVIEVAQLTILTNGTITIKRLDGANFTTSVQFPNQFSGSYRIST